jgi:hypothetical protein
MNQRPQTLALFMTPIHKAMQIPAASVPASALIIVHLRGVPVRLRPGYFAHGSSPWNKPTLLP